MFREELPRQREQSVQMLTLYVPVMFKRRLERIGRKVGKEVLEMKTELILGEGCCRPL